MRWSELFRDLEGQFEAAAAEELAGEVADRTRREFARIRLVDRLRPGVGRPVAVTLAGAGVLHGVLAETGADWFLLEDDRGAEVLVRLAAVLGLQGLDPRVAAEPGSEGEFAARCGLGIALRALARDRAQIACLLVDGSVADGTPDRVGADHLWLASGPPGERAPRAGTASLRLVPFAALAAVRRR